MADSDDKKHLPDWAKKLLESAGVDPNAVSIRREIKDRMRQEREEIERRVEENVRQAYEKARAPIDKQVASIRGRLERLQQKIDAKIEARRKR